ncbi:MAG: MBL fold metallo-hydrolase [Pirellulaceae bacterium]
MMHPDEPLLDSELSLPVQVDLAISDLPGFRSFIGAWVQRFLGEVFIVDPGPAATIPVLEGHLHRLGIESVQHILLTHIHIDHAGGIGHLSQRFPDATIYAHPKAVPHLIDPERLAAGTRKVLGNLCDHYGPIFPVPPARIRSFEQAPCPTWETIGHSPHHVSYLLDGTLYCGEALGVTVPTVGAHSTYLRPATPPKFVYDVYQHSIETLADVECQRYALGHFGSVPGRIDLPEMAMEQIHRWINAVGQHADAPLEHLLRLLQKSDPCFAPFGYLPDVIQQRELIFFRNTVDGIRAFLSDGIRAG